MENIPLLKKMVLVFIVNLFRKPGSGDKKHQTAAIFIWSS